MRFGLANERTLLAWGRTALAIIATGLILGRVLPPGDRGALQGWAGILLAVTGTLLALGSYRDYRRMETAMTRGDRIPRSRLPAVLLLVIVMSGVVAVLLMA